MLKTKIAFIGPGAMAEAMIAGLLREKLACSSKFFWQADLALERVKQLQEKYGVQPFTDNSLAVTQADVVVLSVKPQRLTGVMKNLKGISPGALVLSIIAGASIKKLSHGLKHSAIVRSMPNTPAQIGEGITVWTALRSGQREAKGNGAGYFVRPRQGSLRGGRAIPRHGDGSLRYGSGLRVHVHGSDDRRGRAHGFSAPYRRAAGRPDPARIGGFLREQRGATWPRCATRSPRQAAPQRRRCITSKKPDSARPFRAPSGRPTSVRWNWARNSRCTSLKRTRMKGIQ